MKRKYQRRKIPVRAMITDKKGNRFAFRNRDISFGGVFLLADNPRQFPYEVGQPFEMDLQFHKSVKVITVSGKVARLTRAKSVEAQMYKPGIGIEFTKLDLEGKKVFRSLLS